MDDLTRKFYEENEGNPEALAKAYGVDLVDPDETVEAAKDAAQFAWESLPGIGTAYTVDDIKSELEKEEPNYLKIGLLAGTEVIGLVPGLGTAAKSMIRKGADMARQTDNVVDVASNIPQVPRSVTPSYTDEALLEADDILAEWGKGNLTNPQLRKAMSDKGFKIETKTISPKMTADDIEVVGPDGNIVRWKDMPRGTNKQPQMSNEDYDIRMAALDEIDNITEWQKAAKKEIETGRVADPAIKTPELEESTRLLLENKITREEHLANVDKYKPVNAWDALPREPSNKAVVFSLNDKQRQDGFFVLDNAAEMGVNKSSLKIGDLFNGRLDIPAYNRYDTWIVTGSSKNAEKGKHYAKAIHYRSGDGEPVKFIASEKTSERIGSGEIDKTPYATVQGYIEDLDADAIRAKATEYLNDPEWTQVGFDPRRQGGFYVRAGENKHVPVREATEVIQIGPLILAKNAKLDMEYSGYNKGGMAMNEQMDAVFKSSRTGYAEGGEVGAAPDTTIGVDPVSGNEVPMGATPEEVRDDIPAQLSEGEYVVPADVVRFYGVKFFEDLRTQAKQGYAEMDQNGRIGGEPVSQEASGMEMVEPEDDLPFDISELQIVDDETGMYEGGLAGYAEGGLPAAPTQTPVPTNPFNPTGGTTGFEIKEYVNDAGEVMYVQFMNGQPMTFIPQGFKPKGSVAEEVAKETAATAPVAASSDNDYDSAAEMGKVDTSFTQGASATDWTKATAEEFAKARKQMGFGTTAAGVMGGIMGGPIGLAVGIGSKSQQRSKAYDMIDGIAYQLDGMNENDPRYQDLVDQKKALQKIVSTGDDGRDDSGFIGGTGIFGGKTSMYEGLSDTGGGGYDADGKPIGDNKVTFADTWLGDLLGADGKVGVQGFGLSDSLSGKRRTGGGVYEGDRDRAAERIKAREDSPYQKAMAEKDYAKAADIATKSWQAATNAVQAAGNDPIARHNAIMAQSEASKAATKAIQEKNNRTGFFGLKTKDDE